MGNCGGGAQAKRNKQQLAEAIKALDELGTEKTKLERDLAKVAVELQERRADNRADDKDAAEELNLAQRKNNILQKEVEELEKELRDAHRSAREDLQKSDTRYKNLEDERHSALDRERESAVFSDNLRSRIAELQSELEYVKRCSRDEASILQQKLDRSSISVGEAERLEEALVETKRDRDNQKRRLEEKIAEMMEEAERNREEIGQMQRALDESSFNSERDASLFRQSLLEREDEVNRLETIVNDLETALRETQDAEVDARVAPMYERLQRCLDQISGKEERANGSQSGKDKNHVEMLKQSHGALQQLKGALEVERSRCLEMKESLDQEKVRSQLLLKVIRHFKKKLLLAPAYEHPLTPHDSSLPQVEAY